MITCRDATHLLAGLGLVTAATLGLKGVRDVNATTSALALLLVVLAASTFARLCVAIADLGAAVLALNFFFLPPLGTSPSRIRRTGSRSSRFSSPPGP